jgi:hypothetical protein
VKIEHLLFFLNNVCWNSHADWWWIWDTFWTWLIDNFRAHQFKILCFILSFL